MVSIDDLSDAIFGELMGYSDEVDNKMQSVIEKLSKDVRDTLKTHPDIPEKSGDYKKSFAIKKVAQGQGFKRNVVYSKGHHQLTHLLENGHLTRNGTKRTDAFPHWQDAQKLADELPQRITEAIKK